MSGSIFASYPTVRLFEDWRLCLRVRSQCLDRNHPLQAQANFQASEVYEDALEPRWFAACPQASINADGSVSCPDHARAFGLFISRRKAES